MLFVHVVYRTQSSSSCPPDAALFPSGSAQSTAGRPDRRDANPALLARRTARPLACPAARCPAPAHRTNCWPTAMAARSPCALPASCGISPSPTSRMASGSSVCRTFAKSPSPIWHCNCRASARWRASNSMRPCSRPLKRVWGPIGSSSGTIRPTAISAASNSPRCSPWGSRRSTPFVVTAAISAPCVPAKR